ncbi:anthranilate phosphoribosyltransferase [Polymorphobacter arshaanensis]|uniref:Anthranilate phosphoribosyltransferase n=2 Tax=Glacieibacterium arshaanense TaxID=2511025 RepID=A0A4Y9ET45_9SPHN|nr:anthranilate phosphoribosyltransferase [Polymorphobacter arshaanensis]
MPTLLPNARAPLDAATARAAFTAIMDGAIPDATLADFLVTLADRGETVTEVAAAAAVLRDRATTITAPAGAIDVVGTGGDGKHTLNVSTAVAIVVAACGVPVAKHGNRAASSRSGAADVLAELGVPVALEAGAVARCLDTLGITFLHAARHHGAMARVAGVRKALGRRTIFNLLGPLANPAGVSFQLIGVADPRWLRPFAEVLRELGTKRAMIVHGSDGIDELTVTGPSQIALLDNGHISEATVTPADAGLETYIAAELTGGEPAQNAAALLALVDGTPGAYRDIVLLNAAGALIVAGRASDWAAGAAQAAHAIDSGAARALLDRWKAFQ